ncbi:MAG: dihydrodipicolinate synthase family protein [Acidobacteria bacterium]|nr:dihydrodipicolinate synthase family protein [Acidobacteriota bacterium]
MSESSGYPSNEIDRRVSPGGLVCPLVTPLVGESEESNEQALRFHTEWLIPQVDGLFLLRSSGEFPMLPQRVATQVLDVAVEQVAGRLPLLVGVEDTGTRRTLNNLMNVAHRSVDYVVVTAPFYQAYDTQDP